MFHLKTQIMKKVFLGLLVIASFAACKSTETKPTETVEASSEKVEHLYKPTYTDNFKYDSWMQREYVVISELRDYLK